MVCLSWCMLVQCCIVHYTAGRTIRLGSDDHRVAPGYRIIHSNLFQHTKLTVSVKASLDIFLPVQGHLPWSVNSNRRGFLVYKQAQWWRPVHKREWLVFTTVKC